MNHCFNYLSLNLKEPMQPVSTLAVISPPRVLIALMVCTLSMHLSKSASGIALWFQRLCAMRC